MTTRAVFFDAFGTLIAMDPPAPVLTALLADAGYAMPQSVVADALTVEIGYYRANMQMASDAAALATLRSGCAGVLVDALGPGAPPVPLATDLLVRSLRFHLYDDVLPTLDALGAMGLHLGVVSNWDCALPHHLAALGIADRFAVIAASAAVGAVKPDAAIFHHALSALGVDPQHALHVGDTRRDDLDGARAAGLHALLINRLPGAAPDDECITTLRDIPNRLPRSSRP